MVVIKFKKYHFVLTIRAFQRIITERRENGVSPLVKTAVDRVPASGNGPVEFGINLAVTRIKAAVSNHFKMFFRDMANQTLDKIHCRNRFFGIFFIFMPVVMKSNHFAIVFIDSGSGNHRASKIAADIFDDSFGVAEVWFCVNIKTVFVFGITFGLSFVERRSNFK